MNMNNDPSLYYGKSQNLDIPFVGAVAADGFTAYKPHNTLYGAQAKIDNSIKRDELIDDADVILKRNLAKAKNSVLIKNSLKKSPEKLPKLN